MGEDGREIQQTIEKILASMMIKKVVSVDDVYFLNNSTLENAVTLFEEARAKKDAPYSELIPRDILEAPEEIWTRVLDSIWSKLEREDQTKILWELAHIVGNATLSEDDKSLSLLGQLIPDDMLITLDPNKWEDGREAILTSAEDTQRILCLFDQDLHFAGRADSAGITLLQSTLETYKDKPIICGLLTHKLKKDQELSEARKLASDWGLSLDRFLILSKERLGEAPLEFADGLKMTVLNYARERLSTRVTEITNLASKQAQQQVNEINIYDFEHIVVRSSEKEGVWEPETLFRLFDLFRFNNFRAAALESDNRSLLYKDIEQIRAIRDIQTKDSNVEIPTEQVYFIRKSELFDHGQLINPAHQPLELGDIFEMGENQRYILLAQPCDLMFRKDSSRVEYATLVKIQTIPISDTDPSPVASYKLDYFPDDKGNKAFVKFRTSFQISLNVLDLSVFNGDGSCQLSLEDGVAEVLHLPLRNRLTELQRYYRNVHSEFGRVYAAASSYQKKALRQLLLNSGKDIALDYNQRNGTFKFGIKRIGRYRTPHALQLLSAYFSFLSRNPQEHDFAKKD